MLMGISAASFFFYFFYLLLNSIEYILSSYSNADERWTHNQNTLRNFHNALGKQNELRIEEE